MHYHDDLIEFDEKLALVCIKSRDMVHKCHTNSAFLLATIAMPIINVWCMPIMLSTHAHN